MTGHWIKHNATFDVEQLKSRNLFTEIRSARCKFEYINFVIVIVTSLTYHDVAILIAKNRKLIRFQTNKVAITHDKHIHYI